MLTLKLRLILIYRQTTEMTKIFACLLLTAVFIVTATRPSIAQGRSASLTGTIVDPSGAVIANASVTVRRDAAGYVRQLASDAQGRFELADLPPGEYAITVTSTGFTVATERVPLRAGQTQRVQFT